MTKAGPPSRGTTDAERHSWSYELPPRQATERQCRKCSLECRRTSGNWGPGATLEYRFPGHEWEPVDSYPVCGGRTAGRARRAAWEAARRAGT